LADKQPGPAYVCGRLYATLYALRAVGVRDRSLKTDKNLNKAKQHPGPHLREHLAQAGRHLLAARERGPKYGTAATELFLAIAEFSPLDGKLPGYLHGTLQDDFHAGFRHQYGAYVIAYGDLVR
jgi:hypothetical protein